MAVGIPVSYWLHCFLVDNFIIFNFHFRKLVNCICNSCGCFLNTKCFRPFKTFFKNTVYVRCHIALMFRQANITRTQGQTVVSTDNRTRNYFKIKAFQLYHAPYHGNLLKILFPKIGPVRPYHFKKPAHHLGNPVEMSGTHGSFHDLGNRAKVEYPGVRLRIDLFNRRHKRNVDTGLPKFFTIGFFRTRICLQIVGVVKLRRVYKNADNNHVVVGTSTLHQRHMSLVQRPHGRNKSDFLLI